MPLVACPSRNDVFIVRSYRSLFRMIRVPAMLHVYLLIIRWIRIYWKRKMRVDIGFVRYEMVFLCRFLCVAAMIDDTGRGMAKHQSVWRVCVSLCGKRLPQLGLMWCARNASCSPRVKLARPREIQCGRYEIYNINNKYNTKAPYWVACSVFDRSGRWLFLWTHLIIVMLFSHFRSDNSRNRFVECKIGRMNFFPKLPHFFGGVFCAWSSPFAAQFQFRAIDKEILQL